jgi:transcriptional regulator with XRE-family HTH domain
MTLGEKLRYLREIEGTLRGLGRALTQQELVRAIHAELGSTISQAYVSQVEIGKRPHLTDSTRTLLSRFFKVHPGYLVNDPAGFHTELMSDIRTAEDTLDLWLVNGAERFAADREVSAALLGVARYDDSRRALVLLGAILEIPDLANRLLEVLKPGAAAGVRTPAARTHPKAHARRSRR